MKECLKKSAKAETHACRICGAAYGTLNEAISCEILCLEEENKKKENENILEIDKKIKENSKRAEEIQMQIEQLEEELRKLDDELEKVEKEGLDLIIQKHKIQNPKIIIGSDGTPILTNVIIKSIEDIFN